MYSYQAVAHMGVTSMSSYHVLALIFPANFTPNAPIFCQDKEYKIVNAMLPFIGKNLQLELTDSCIKPFNCTKY